MIKPKALETLTNTYIETGIWADSDHDDKCYGISEQGKQKALKDCLEFVEKVEKEFTPQEASQILNDYVVGHDFWLTRNHHGAGFWDRDIYNEIAENGGERLTKIAHTFNEISVWTDDEKKEYNIE